MYPASTEKRTRIGVLFGGRSVEHEISVITALELIDALDVMRYEPVPIYIDMRGRWFSGRALMNRDFYRQMPGSLAKVREVTLLPVPNVGGLTPRRRDSSFGRETETIPVDVFIPAFHGQFGEDGCIQGLLELADVAYTGCDVLASSVAMNKHVCKSVLGANGIPVLPGAVVNKADILRFGISGLRDKILKTKGINGYPLFVKPCNLGSSIGVGRAHDDISLESAIAKVFKYDNEAIIEPCVSSIMEINVSVCEGAEPVASVIEIPVSQTGVLTYEDKYLRGGKGKKGPGSARGMASLVRMIDPPDIDPKYREDVIKYAKHAYSVLRCGGVVRFDFMVNLENGNLTFNELNPFPGSLAYYLWAKSTPRRLYTETLTHIIERAKSKKLQARGLIRDMGFKALFR